MSTFGIDRKFLQDMLVNIRNGNIQLPEFQREWVWDDYRIRSLIASVSQAFPIGAVLTLGAGGTDIQFSTRLIEGVNPEDADDELQTLILDGQQRLTALFQSLMLEAVSIPITPEKKMLRYYYLDMEECIRDKIEREEAVFSCGEDRQLQTSHRGTIDISSVEEEYTNNIFPVNKIFDSDDWRMEYEEHWKFIPDKIKFFNSFQRMIIRHFERYTVPVISLDAGTPIEAVCLVFERVNTRGVTLTVFELLTATFAVSGYELRKDWENRLERLKEASPTLEELDSTNFLRALTLLVTHAKTDTTVSCTRRDILRLKVEDYKKWADLVEKGFVKAAHFLHKQKIFNSKDLPYQTQLVPLTAILVNLDTIGELAGAQQKIANWYWCGVFGEMYGAATDTRFANDFYEVTDWIREKTHEKPRTMQEANFQENRLEMLRTRGSAAYKGVYAMLMHDGCRDFRTDETIELQTFFDDNIDIHHIFPKRWCEKQKNIDNIDKIDKDVYNSIINKTALSSRTNRIIGGRAPSEYLRNLERDTQAYLPLIEEDTELNCPDIDQILASHLICPNTLRNDDFHGFFKARKEALLEVIEKAMGKKVIREDEELSNVEE